MNIFMHVFYQFYQSRLYFKVQCSFLGLLMFKVIYQKTCTKVVVEDNLYLFKIIYIIIYIIICFFKCNISRTQRICQS